ncbi:MAG: class I SAM-dependent methyltransferase [Hyphomicrobiaceae bacterium]|nr:class I SAM-dependent methyltransferase [Hyphomicrobiaceae bacterium]
MTMFSSDWLSLRESADLRSRNREIVNAVSAWFGLREHMHVLDLGAGTGSNLRATAPLLCNKQSWTLVDTDADLIAHARQALRRWADSSEPDGNDGLRIRKGHAEISVSFQRRDLAAGLGDLVKDTDLVTASAFFDLVSAAFIRELARTLAAARVAFYGALTYNGLQKWTPHRPTDNQIAAAFNRHQLNDKGFGPAAGPMAPALLADQFRLEGYSVVEGESPWKLDQSERTLIAELQRGHAMAVLETGALDAKLVEGWVKVIRSGVEIGHTDIFASPA